MKIENSIGWCDATTNAVTGCDKVSPGCAHCYAQVGTRARVLRAQGIETWGPKGVRHSVAEFAEKIRRLNKLCVCDLCHTAHPAERLSSDFKSCGAYPNGTNYSKCFGDLRRIRLFADSNSDWLDEKWPMEVFIRFLNEIRLAPNVDVLLLTKRPENFKSRLTAAMQHLEDGNFIQGERGESEVLWTWILDWVTDEKIPPHILLGVSVENQAMADLRIPQLLQIPAAVRFLSCEPLLEVVGIPRVVDWVIVGGESGNDRRDCGVLAIEAVAAQCEVLGVPLYVKQDCAFRSGERGRIPDEIWRLKQFPKEATR